MDEMLDSSYGWLLYKERFAVLFVCMLASFSAGILWMSYSTIPNLAADYYKVSIDEINLLPISVLICSVLFSLIAMYTLDKRNLKTGLRLGSSLIVIGYFIRILPNFSPFIDQRRYIFALFGHCFVGFGLPFVIFTPSKVAEHWFPDNLRLSVTTVVSVSYLSGLIFSDLVVERIIERSTYDLTDVTIFIGIPSVISLILCFLLNKSKPNTPPSGSSAIICFRPFFPSLAQLIKQKVFIILIIYIGVVMGSFLSTILIVQELVKVNLNLIVFSGEFAAFYTIGGLLGALLSSLFAGKIKNVVFTMKILVCGHSIASTLLFLVLRLQISSIDKYYWKILILFISGCTGFFVYTVIPFGLELGSDSSFPNCTEAASNGLLIISGQVFGLLLTLLMRGLAYWKCACDEDTFNALRIQSANIGQSSHNRTVINEELNCSDAKCWYDYSISLMTQTIIIVFAGSFFVACFHTEYRRMNNNRQFNVNRILNIEEVDESDTLYS